MRLGVVIAVVGLSALLILGLRYILPSEAIPRAEAPATDVSQAHSEDYASKPVPEIPPPSPPPGGRATTPAASGVEANPAGPEEAQEALFAARLERCRHLAAQTDDASLETLISELMNPDREFRTAVLDVITQAGNRAVIPKLEALAFRLEDPAAQQEILDAVDFLQLPTLTEMLNQASGATNSGPR
jgi:hypothetical protein